MVFNYWNFPDMSQNTWKPIIKTSNDPRSNGLDKALLQFAEHSKPLRLAKAFVSQSLKPFNISISGRNSKKGFTKNNQVLLSRLFTLSTKDIY